MDLSIISCPIDHGHLEKIGPNKYQCMLCEKVYIEENGILDMNYSDLPNLDGHVPYIWSDVFYFENLLKQLARPHSTIVEVCSGPNIIVPLLLKRLHIPVNYYSIGIDQAHLRQQRNGVAFPIQSIQGDATRLPLSNHSVDLYIGHHAINDVWLSKGSQGVEQSYKEMHRVIKYNGYIIHSDCILQHDTRVGDPSTKIIGLNSLKRFLDANEYSWVQENGGEMDWIIASQRNKIHIRPSDDFNLSPSII